MKLLLDTHIFLWYISADPRLPTKLREAIQYLTDEVYLSVASVWEAIIKHTLGKLPLPMPPAEFLPAQRISHRIASLTIDEGTLVHLAQLPSLHRDPFDRVIIAQSIQHGLTLASLDNAVRAYPVPVWSVS